MRDSSNKLSQFWQELKRRKVLYFLIGYVAACPAIIEFFLNASETFSLPEQTIRLLYQLSAIGIPVVILLPWFIYRKKKDDGESNIQATGPGEVVQTHRHNLPAQLTTFIGRAKEMQTIQDLICEHRLVTLTGTGGCGKTRLACEAAATMVQDFSDGVWFVDLAPLTNEDLVAKEITEVLKITESPNQPVIETLTEKIKDQKIMIILDNCEHLIKGCGEVCATLLQSVPGLKILATTREAMKISGEKVWRLPSLTLLDPKLVIDMESAQRSEAVLLFTDRAQLNNPEFELEPENVSEVVSICNKLDGIPLAVELVASRTRHLHPKKILERFEDRFDLLVSPDPGISKRQQTLQATIEWSYNLLSESERTLFERISVFSGGFELEAAEEVCSDDQLQKESVLDVLSMLVDQSLVYTMKGRDQSMRYNRLETLRQFAQQKLINNREENEIRSRHLQYYLKVAEVAYEEQFEAQLKWAAWHVAEQDNVFAALNWAESNSPERYAELAGFVYWFWRLRSDILVGIDYLEKAITKNIGKAESYARAVTGLGCFYWMTGDAQKALKFMRESLEIWRKLENPGEEAFTLSEISEPLLHSGDYETSLKYSEEGLEIARKLGNPSLINHCQIYLCTILVHTKQFERGRPLVEELLISSEKLNQLFSIEGALHLLGDCTVGMKDFKEGEKRYAKGVEVSYKHGNMIYVAFDIQGVAFAIAGQGRWAKSIRLDAAAREQYNKLGLEVDGMFEFWDEFIATHIEGARKEVGEELAKRYDEEGIAMGTEKAIEYALDFEKD